MTSPDTSPDTLPADIAALHNEQEQIAEAARRLVTPQIGESALGRVQTSVSFESKPTAPAPKGEEAASLSGWTSVDPGGQYREPRKDTFTKASRPLPTGREEAEIRTRTFNNGESVRHRVSYTETKVHPKGFLRKPGKTEILVRPDIDLGNGGESLAHSPFGVDIIRTNQKGEPKVKELKVGGKLEQSVTEAVAKRTAKMLNDISPNKDLQIQEQD